MSVKVNYKGEEILSVNTDITKTLKTSGKYCEDDIEVVNTQDGGITPSGNIDITSMAQVDVTNYATAQVVDADLVASNIKKDVNILGVVGSFEGGGGGDTFRKTSVVVASDTFNTLVNRANITPLSSNEILIWNIRGTIQQRGGSAGGKFGITVLQNGAIVSHTVVYKRMASIAAPDDSTPSSIWANGGVDGIANGHYSASTTLFYVGIGNTIDFLQIPYNIGFAVGGA